MKSDITFSPHNWEGTRQPKDSFDPVQEVTQTVEKKELDSIEFQPEMDDSLDSGAEGSLAAPDFEDLFQRAEASASNDFEPDESLINESAQDSDSLSHDEIGEGEDAAYARGFIDGEEKQLQSQLEALKNAEKKVIDIKKEIENQKIELSRDMEKTIFSFVQSIAHHVFDDLISENASKLIIKKAKEFIHEHALYDFSLTLELSSEDHRLFMELDGDDILGDVQIVANRLLKSGRAILIASPKNGLVGELRAQMDVHEIVDSSLKGEQGA